MAESNLVETLEEEEKKIQNETKSEESKSYKEIFSQIISDFSEFLSKRSVYEAAPENSKVLVFNSDLSFKEMIKAFINEDIYCALIYDSKKEYFIGIITISDILFLFQYIIDKAQEKVITDYDIFIKEIFSVNKMLTTEEETANNTNNKKDKNFDILKYLTKINYNDYFTVIKQYKKIHTLFSISLDASLLDVLKLIYKVGVHRLVVEETKKKGIPENKKKENDINIQNNLDNTLKTDKEKEKSEIKSEVSLKEKSDIEKNDKEKSDKKIKKVKTKKKMSVDEESKESEKKVKKKKIKKKKAEDEEGKDNNNKDKEDKEKDKDKEEGEKIVKKKTVKKIVKKKKVETESDNKDKVIEKDKDKEKNEEKKEEDKISEDKKDIDNQKSEKSVKQIEENSNKEVLKLNTEEEQKNNNDLSSETQNYTGFVTYETVFDFLIYNYYSMEMKEFDLTLEDLKKIPLNTSFIKPITNFALINEEVHSSFSKNISTKSDLLPILTEDKNEIFGFLYLRDYLFFVSNCNSNQNLTNEQFLINMYDDIDDEKPYGKERIIYLEYNEESKKLKIKYLLEKINGAPEKKIVLKDKEDGNKLYIISLKSVFDTLVEINENNK